MKKENMLLVGIGIISIVLLFLWFFPNTFWAEYEKTELNYDNTIKNIAEDLRGVTVEGTLENDLEYVYSKVTYVDNLDSTVCYSDNVSSILKRGTGDCRGMNEVLSNILSAQGIEHTEIVGCLKTESTCKSTFSMVEKGKIVTPMTKYDFNLRGNLHKWLVVDINGKRYILEPTSGSMYTDGCNAYLKYNGYNYDKCMLNDLAFWLTCNGEV